MELVYGNCFGAAVRAAAPGAALLTEEPGVADAAGVVPPYVDEWIDPDLGERTNRQVWRFAFDWFRAGGDDPSLEQGISTADIAAVDCVISTLLPAARGALATDAALARLAPDSVVAVSPRAGTAAFLRAEGAQAAGFAAVAAARGCRVDRLEVDDARDAQLVAKYRHVRDPEWLTTDRRALLRRDLVRRLTELGRLGRKRDALLVVEYNPTAAFARRYSHRPHRRFSLVRVGASSRDLPAALRAGDVLGLRERPRRTVGGGRSSARIQAWVDEHDGLLAGRLEVAGVSLWPVVREQLLDRVAFYSGYVAQAAPAIERSLRRLRVGAVLVPFDSPPAARLIVRVAQSAGVPTYVINNGIMADEFQAECLTADVGLAWSEALRASYFSRRRHGETYVVGNPKRDTFSPAERQHDGFVLVGSFTFSPVDVNCRRSDAETYATTALAAVRRAAPAARVVLKLHPADTGPDYGRIAGSHGAEVVDSGDVGELFTGASVYVCTYSTSLLEAAARGLPVIYLAVNHQRLLAPFSGDAFLSAWTARSEDDLAGLVRRALDEPPDAGVLRAFAERYLGSLDGRSAERVAARLGDPLGAEA